MTDWKLIEETGQIASTLEDGRQQNVAWDAGDRSLYLSIVVPAKGMGQQSPPRAYSAPLSLLAAMTLVPQHFHAYLVQLHLGARAEAEAEAMEFVHGVVEKLPLSFPEPTRAVELLAKSAKAAGHVERLSLDLAAADAFVDMAPV